MRAKACGGVEARAGEQAEGVLQGLNGFGRETTALQTDAVCPIDFRFVIAGGL